MFIWNEFLKEKKKCARERVRPINDEVYDWKTKIVIDE